MPTTNLIIELLDKKQTFPNLKAKYDTETRIAIVHRGLKRTVANKFLIDPNHIFQEIHGHKIRLKVFVDNASRKSTSMKELVPGKEGETPPPPTQEVPVSINVSTDDNIDGKTKNKLDYLIEEVFWKSLIAKNKIPLSTLLIMFAAGGGIFFMIKEIILPLFGVVV